MSAQLSEMNIFENTEKKQTAQDFKPAPDKITTNFVKLEFEGGAFPTQPVIIFEQDGARIPFEAVNAEKDLVVTWPPFTAGRADEDGILDDLIISRWGEDSFFLVVNAACKKDDLRRMYAAIGDRCVVDELDDLLGHPVPREDLEDRTSSAGVATGLAVTGAGGDVLFVDEIHRLSPVVEEILYPAMEDFQLDVLIGQGPSARSIRIDLPRFTLVGATTRTGMLTSPLQDRFGFGRCGSVGALCDHAGAYPGCILARDLAFQRSRYQHIHIQFQPTVHPGKGLEGVGVHHGPLK